MTGHDFSNTSDAMLEARILDIADGIADPCGCDDFEVDDGVVIRRCAWDSINTLEGELAKREIVAAR